MRLNPVRRLAAFGGALILGAAGLTGPALAGPALPQAPSAPPAPMETGGERPSAEPRIPVLITLKKQPSNPSESGESASLSAQKELIARWSDRYDLTIDRQFGYLFNGMSATIPASQLGALSLEPEVQSVRRERVYERAEHTARQVHGVPAAFRDHGVDGTGMVISIIDSGIDPAHRDMRLDDCAAAKIQEINSASEGGFTCKVPTGYNYADESFVVKDTAAAPHGQHVAGIAAANGSPGDEAGDVVETRRIDGIAPNAQLLAMKVFSNQGGGAADSDIIAAIEDSVKLDADVINMSLGSPNGLKNTSNGTSIAIEAAREAGVVTVIAAGNDGQNFSPTGGPDDALGLHDDGTVGSPSTQGSALSVASLDNTELTQAVAYHGDPEKQVAYELATGQPDDQAHEVIDIGVGDEAGIAGRDLNGAYALIERGGLTFTEKYENAINAGAAGVVMFNHEDGGEATFGMAGVEEFTIPGIIVPRSAGLAMREEIAAGGTTIRITEDLMLSENPTGLEPSSFTSWGATPTLDFEPEIAGIGGGVYSTYNDDTYGPNSGTSMASPNVAGVLALVLEHLKQARPDVTGAARVDLAKTMLMNTALVPTDDNGVPFSPRQVGAGLAQVDRALATDVTATVDGVAAAALRQVNGSASFTVTLNNTGDQPRTFTVPADQQVLAETNAAGEPTTVRVSSGTLAVGASSVTVPAGGTATVDVTVTPEAGGDHFMGGWLRLASDAADQVDLSVPYLGFAGDWNAENIILPPGEKLTDDLDVQTQLLTGWGGATIPLTSELGEFWLSPNGDGDMDIVAMNMAMMRNATDVRYEILDADKKAIKTIGQEQDVYRPLLGDYMGAENPGDAQWTGATFGGTIWNPQTADFEPLPDGRYTYRVSARLSEDYPWQTTDVEFGLDATAPEITFGPVEQNVLTFSVTEDGSGLLETPTVTNAAGDEIPVVDRGDGTYAVEVDPAQVPFVTVASVDAGFNLGVASKVFTDSQVVVAGADKLQKEVLGPKSAVVSDGKLVVSGFVSSDITTVRIAGQKPVDSANGRFRDGVDLTEGTQDILVEGLGADGQVIASQTLTVTYDSTAPTVKITDMPKDDAGAAVLDDNGSVVVRGTITDERKGAQLGLELTAAGKTTPVDVAADGSFEVTVTPGAKDHAFVLTGTDGQNSAPVTVPIAGRQAPLPAFTLPTETNVECLLEQGACFVPGNTPDVNEEGSVFTFTGKAGENTGSIVLRREVRLGEDGTYPEPQDIPATIAKDGTFSVDLPMTTGENGYRMIITDKEGKVRFDRGVRFFFDVTAPTLTVEEPTLIGGTLYTATPEVAFRGTASDDGWGYGLRLNDSVVIERFDRGSPGEQSNRREFSADLTVADGDTVLLEYGDANGNILLAGIPVVLDQDAPTASVDRVADDEIVTDGREVTITSTDDHLATQRVTLNGEVIADQATDLSTSEQAVEDVLVDSRDLLAEQGADEQAPQDQAPDPSDGGGDEGTANSAASARGAATDTAEGSAQSAPEDAAAPSDVSVAAAQTGPNQTALETTLATADLAPGRYTLSVVATDLAGNMTTQTRVFEIPSVLAITGEDSVSLEVHREQLADQGALTQLVLDQYGAELDGDAKAAAAAGAELSLAPGTVLVPGEQTVTVLATDDQGRTAEREVTVTVNLKEVTLRDGDVTATSTFRSDDVLSASITTDGRARTLTMSTEHASLSAVITVPGVEGSAVARVLEDGREVPVRATFADGVLTFTGPSHATYRITEPAAPGDGQGGNEGGDQGGNGQGDDQGSGRGGEHSGGSGDGSRTDRPTPGARGPLAVTGVEVAGLAVLALLAVAGGAALLRRRKRGTTAD